MLYLNRLVLNPMERIPASTSWNSRTPTTGVNYPPDPLLLEKPGGPGFESRRGNWCDWHCAIMLGLLVVTDWRGYVLIALRCHGRGWEALVL